MIGKKALKKVALALMMLAPSAFAAAEKAVELRPGGTGSIEVQVEGMPSGEGILFVSLYLTETGYPDDWQVAYRTLQLDASGQRGGVMSTRLNDVPAGWFVIAILHDADSNKEMKTNFLGIPKEAYGFSQNPKARFGPPSWDDAAVFLEPDATSVVNIKLK